MKWKSIVETIKKSPNNVTLKERNISIFKPTGLQDIYDFNPLNEIIRHVDTMSINGYLRICGANIQETNNLVKECYPGEKVVIATDVFGGIFVISNGDFSGVKTSIWYYAPDTLQWEDLRIDYEQFLQWVFNGDVELFYSSFCWEGIENDVKQIDESQAVLIYPFLWSAECDITTATKKIVPFGELVKINADNQNIIGD